jgi:hypothetical protein
MMTTERHRNRDSARVMSLVGGGMLTLLALLGSLLLPPAGLTWAELDQSPPLSAQVAGPSYGQDMQPYSPSYGQDMQPYGTGYGQGAQPSDFDFDTARPLSPAAANAVAHCRQILAGSGATPDALPVGDQCTDYAGCRIMGGSVSHCLSRATYGRFDCARQDGYYANNSFIPTGPDMAAFCGQLDAAGDPPQR